jgi:serine/threonine protein kinase
LAAESPQTLSPALPPGTLLKEYSLLSVLGMGGFGITYLAADTNLHLKVAIKEFFPSSAAVRNQFSGAVALKSEQAQAEYAWGKDRFMREAQTLARFRHKNIVQVFRYFEANGTCYMVMAYEEGQCLEDALEADPARWDTQAVLALMMPLLDGLESVHAAGFLHRDIKPANIVLRAGDGSPVLIDFGAARAPTSSDALTVVISHGYGPPEQYSRQGKQGPWTDIYALGGVLYRIVTGAVPPMSLHRVQHDPIIPATFHGEGRFEPQFLKAIDRALEVDETKRPQSIAEWRKQLVGGTADLAGVATPPDVGAKTAAPASSQTPAAPSSRVRISQRVAHPFLSLLLLVAALVAGPQLLRRPATPPAPPQVVPTVVQAPAPAFDAPAERPAPPAASTDNERQPNIRRAAIAACRRSGVSAFRPFYLPIWCQPMRRCYAP